MKNKFEAGTILRHIHTDSYVTVHSYIDDDVFNGIARIDGGDLYKTTNDMIVLSLSNWDPNVTIGERNRYVATLLAYGYSYDSNSNMYISVSTNKNNTLDYSAIDTDISSTNNKIKQIEIPLVEVEGCTFEESTYVYCGKRWSADDLYMYAKHNNLPIFDLPLAAINLTLKPFQIDNMYDLISHIIRVNQCDCDIPIILDDLGQIADGVHRVCKAIAEGRHTIKAIRLHKMPQSTIPID